MTRAQILRAMESHSVALTHALFAAERAEGTGNANGLRTASAQMHEAVDHLAALSLMFEAAVNDIDLGPELVASLMAVREGKDDTR